MGDTNMCTDNPVLLRNTHNERTIICAQRKAAKVVPTEGNIIEANKLAFNDDIGTITNYVTSMFDVQAGFEKGSDEYKELDYRIKCGQLMQQNSIDRAKGIIAKPMPEYWYSYRAIDKSDNRAELNEKIVAAYKPYFMTYVYPGLKSQYCKYVRDSDISVSDKFYAKYGITSINDLMEYQDKTDEMNEFISHYLSDRKIGMNPCVVNRICFHLEDAFPSFGFSRRKNSGFDYSILKSGVQYTEEAYKEIEQLYKTYKYELDNFKQNARLYSYDDGCGIYGQEEFISRFKMRAERICSNKYELCDIVLDLCYQSENSKQFAWDVSGSTIVENLLKKNAYMIHYPFHGGDEFEYQGDYFSMKQVCLTEDDLT